MRSVRVLALALALGSGLAPMAVSDDSRPAAISTQGETSCLSPLPQLDRRYRIIGRLRLALFWVSRDDVGGARMTWRRTENGSSIALLAGSDPRHAPRALNQWAYLREAIQGPRAEVFALRSGAMDLVPRPTGPKDEPGLLSAGCAEIENGEVRSLKTSLNAPGVDFRMLEGLLGQIGTTAPWHERRTRQRAGAEPGFLTAFERLMRHSLDASSTPIVGPRVPYVHDSNSYDLELRKIESLGRTTVGTHTFEQLRRGDFVVHNTATKTATKFVVTFEPAVAAATLPVQIIYQPNWWLNVELRIDDDADVPTDPGADETTLARIDEICASAMNGGVSRRH